MSDNTDWTLIVMASQKAQVAAEAALASARLQESETGYRLTAIEARLTGVEGRLTTIGAGQSSHELAIVRITDTQADHTARLTRIEAKQEETVKTLALIEAKLP